MSEFDRCESCLHWQRFTTTSSDGVCRMAMVLNGKFQGAMIDIHVDEPGDDAKLVTNAAFGCVLHEEREE